MGLKEKKGRSSVQQALLPSYLKASEFELDIVEKSKNKTVTHVVLHVTKARYSFFKRFDEGELLQTEV